MGDTDILVDIVGEVRAGWGLEALPLALQLGLETRHHVQQVGWVVEAVHAVLEQVAVGLSGHSGAGGHQQQRRAVLHVSSCFLRPELWTKVHYALTFVKIMLYLTFESYR